MLLFQLSNYDSIKIGMKDTQVEKLVGLPVQIFRGFTELVDYSVELKGQQNYICWRYKKSKRTIIDTIIQTEAAERVKGFKVDTSLAIEDSLMFKTNALNDYYGDTIYYFKNLYYNRLIRITKVEYSKAMLSLDSVDARFYGNASTKSKRLKYDTIYYKESYQRPVSMIQHYLFSNMCILFEPASNRVVQCDYYPTEVMSKVIKIY